MSFEKFTPSKQDRSRRRVQFVRFYENAQRYNCTLSQAMVDALSLADYAYVDLYCDNETKQVAFEPTNEKSAGTSKLQKLHYGACRVTSSSWLNKALNEYGYEQKRRYPYSIQNGLIVIEKDT